MTPELLVFSILYLALYQALNMQFKTYLLRLGVHLISPITSSYLDHLLLNTSSVKACHACRRYR